MSQSLFLPLEQSTKGEAYEDRVPLGISAIGKEGEREHSDTREDRFSVAIRYVRPNDRDSMCYQKRTS
jgi:hypothetical protein